MFNKKRIVIFVGFLCCLFFMTTFAGTPTQNSVVYTRSVEFLDEFDNSSISTETIEVGKDATVPSDPYHEGLVFLGWFLYDNQDERVEDFTNILNDLKVIAKYASDINRNGVRDDVEPRYTVTFVDSINGRVLSTQEVLPGLNASAPVVPVHNNMTFVRWSESYTNINSDLRISTVYRSNVETNVNEIIDDPVEEVVYYTITFIDSDTNQVLGTTEVEEGQDVILPLGEDKPLRLFVRWEGNTLNIRENTTIEAIYTDDINDNKIADSEEDNRVTYDNKGYSLEMPVDSKSYIFDEEYKLMNVSNSEMDDYIFLGWTIREDIPVLDKTNYEQYKDIIVNMNETYNMPEGGVTYYVVLAKDENNDDIEDFNQYNIIYNKNLDNVLGDLPEDNNIYNVNDEVILDNSNLTLDGALFLGWSKSKLDLIETSRYYEDNKDKIINDKFVILEDDQLDIVLYAVFVKSLNGVDPIYVHKVTYNYNSLDDSLNVISNSKFNKVMEGSKLDIDFVKPEDFKTSVNMYRFIKWINEDTKEDVSSETVVNEDTNLKAVYDIYANVTFVGANGSESKDVKVGTNAVLENEDIKTLTNYTFNGWDKSLDNIQVNTVINAKYIANITGLNVTMNNNMFNSGVTEQNLRDALEVIPTYDTTNYDSNLITKEELVYTINGFNSNVGVHNATVNFKNISKQFTYSVVDSNISNEFATSKGYFKQAGTSYYKTNEDSWGDAGNGRIFCLNKSYPCNVAPNPLYRSYTTLVTFNNNIVELDFDLFYENVLVNLSKNGKVYYTDGTSKDVNVSKINYSTYYANYQVPGRFYDLKLAISGSNNTNILDSGKTIQYIELSYVENGVNHKVIYKNNNGNYTVLR